MTNINRVFIAGNLTRDVQVRFLANEQSVANFGIAINRKYKSNGETKEDVTFVDIEAWGRTAELCGQYLTKGRACFIEGRLKLDSWEDKEGKKQSKLRVVAENVQFLGGRQDVAAEHGAESADAHAERPARQSRQVPSPAPSNDETPF